MKKLMCMIIAILCLATAFAEESLMTRFTGEEADPNSSAVEAEYELLDGVRVGSVLRSYGEADTMTAGQLLADAVGNHDDSYGSNDTVSAITRMLDSGDSVSLISSELYAYPDDDDPEVIGRQIEYYEFSIDDEELGTVTALVQCGFELNGGEWTDIRVPALESESYGTTMGEIVNCDSWVSLRAIADTTSERITKVPLGAKVEIYDIVDDFYYCDYEGDDGYILCAYVAVIND